MEDTQNKSKAMPTATAIATTTIAPTNGGEISPNIIIEKKKRGRKKNPVILVAQVPANTLPLNDSSSNSENTIVPEKKPRKKRTVKPKVVAGEVAGVGAGAGVDASTGEGDESAIAPIKKRKRRVCKNQDSKLNTVSVNNTDPNATGDNNTNDNNEDSNNASTNANPPEEKVAKKRGRKPKGGKIITQLVDDNNNTNDMPNIILHLKCSLSSIKNNDSNSLDDSANNNSNIESYNSSKLTGSEINTGMRNNTEPCRKSLHNVEESINNNNNNPNVVVTATAIPNNSILSNYTNSSMFKVYDPNISLPDGNSNSNGNSNSGSNSTGDFSLSEKCMRRPEDGRFSANACNLTNSSNSINSNMFNITYSPNINAYNNNNGSNDCIMTYGNNINDIYSGKDRDRDRDNEDDTDTANINEREIWRKINQLKLSFHKSDICQNIGGTQRSACFWCTCEFDSPAIYIPKSCSKEGYQVYGCFCSPECAAAFLMNENIDTSTRFERYHLLNSVYGKIYKYEKSIKIAPNPYYLLNKYYGNLTIQEYRKLFHSDQMIYVVNKPLTHILPELYEDNNDFLLNTKIIPTHSVNIKKNKPLKSNILNNAFGIN
jgi:hypothetical protein